MSFPELSALSGVELAEKIRTREVSPVEVVDAALARIDRLDPRLNSFVTVMRQQARADAQAAERELAEGHYRGPLHGLPVCHKDICDVAGVKMKTITRAE